MIKYPDKILLALSETLNDNNDILKWFMENNYVELVAFTHAIKGSDDALNWLVKHKHLQLAAICEAIDDDNKAFKWLKTHKFNEMTVMISAIKGNGPAYEWIKQNYPILNRIVDNIRKIKIQQEKEDNSISKALYRMHNPFARG